MQPHVSAPRRSSRWPAVLLVCITVALIAWVPVHAHLRAAAVLMHIQSDQVSGVLAKVGMRAVHVDDGTFEDGATVLRTRIYSPVGVRRTAGMVIVHGVHHLGYNEPRLVRFARAMSSAGIIVSTPELPEVARYEIRPVSIRQIGAAANDLAARLHTSCVGVLGLSFAGGLALQAASDPEMNRHICYVVSIGAHEDMTRVMRFFATDKAEYPDGTVQPMESHEYGALVAIHAHPEDYFSVADAPLAREAVREQLFEHADKAKELAAKLSPQGQATMQMLFSRDHAPAKAILLANLERHRAESDACSPASELYRIHVPVMLLHGAGDNVIPPSELLWLSRDVPRQYLRGALISPAISHVELGKNATWLDKLKLVHWVEKMLEEANDAPFNTVDLSKLGGTFVVSH